MYIACGAIILLTILFFLELYRQVKFNSSIKSITTALDEILEGNLNRRIFAGEQAEVMKRLAYKLNLFLEVHHSAVQKNEHTEEVRKRMISDISHDIRTPLTSIQGYVEALQNDRNLNNKERKEYLNMAAIKCQSLNNLVQSIFEISRLDETDTALSLDKTDINASIRLVLSGFYNDFESAGITPEIQLLLGPTFVYANGAALERVLQNLVSNALFYGREGGFFGISVEEDSNKIWVNIWDKGRGIPIDEMNHIFERSYNFKLVAEGKPHISGLGLAIVKKLIEKQNGEIVVNSIPGEKTVFSFYLQKY